MRSHFGGFISYDTRPGPGVYMLPPLTGYDKHDVRKLRYPAYSMGIKTPILGMGLPTRTPGPQYMIEKNYTRFGKNGIPAYTMRPQLPHFGRMKIPGPGTYAPEKCPRMKEQRPPAYSMASRTPLRKHDQTPGPNRYEIPTYLGPKVPTKPASAAYTMTGRPHGLSGFQGPGPAQYNPADLNKYKHKPPQYSIAGRNQLPGDRTRIPGPAAYYPGYLPGPDPPKFSFGIKHSPYMEPLILETDN
ncbi:ciliary microtubule associated protein 1A-like [Anabrus simplex]|uniref:ciliary microtubule associated protein 1A-like n=1 Tax=Anabrus simplex TaxID=316456 RepID=UPI0034DD1ED7